MTALTQFAALRETFYQELLEFSQIPSISTLPEHAADVRAAADWLVQKLGRCQFTRIQIFETPRHPIVYAEYCPYPDRPTALVYGHYDVQPVDPLDEWQSDPFTPTVRGENLYARGVSDMKGQVLATLNAIQAWQLAGGLPVNVKVVLEGEEEIGSPNLPAFIAQNRALLAADFSFNADAGALAANLPAITYGLRGLVYFELWIHSAQSDLHSGLYGGAVPNAAQVLSDVLAKMHDQNNRVTLPNFYDSVRPLSPAERAELARFPISAAQFQANANHPLALHGETGYTFVEQVGARPTLEINGLNSGYTAVGAKTVLPAKAMAKISCRLVPYQDPDQVALQLQHFLQAQVPDYVRWDLHRLEAGGPAVLLPTDLPAVHALQQALLQTFGVQPVFRLEGGSIPVVSLLQTELGMPSVLSGFSLPDDAFHAPNEKLHLPTFWRGNEALITFFELLATQA